MGATNRNAQLSEDERAYRQQIVDETRASIAFVGGRTSGLTHAVQDQWVRGDLTLNEMTAEIRRAHPSTIHPEKPDLELPRVSSRDPLIEMSSGRIY